MPQVSVRPARAPQQPPAARLSEPPSCPPLRSGITDTFQRERCSHQDIITHAERPRVRRYEPLLRTRGIRYRRSTRRDSFHCVQQCLTLSPVKGRQRG